MYKNLFANQFSKHLGCPNTAPQNRSRDAISQDQTHTEIEILPKLLDVPILFFILVQLWYQLLCMI